MTISPHPHSPKPDNRLFPAVLQCLQCLQCKLHQATRFQVSQCQLRTNFSCDLYAHSLSHFFGNFVCVTYLVGTEYLPDLPTWHTFEIGQFRNNCNVLHFIYWGTINMCFFWCVIIQLHDFERAVFPTDTQRLCLSASAVFVLLCVAVCWGFLRAPSPQCGAVWRSTLFSSSQWVTLWRTSRSTYWGATDYSWGFFFKL